MIISGGRKMAAGTASARIVAKAPQNTAAISEPCWRVKPK